MVSGALRRGGSTAAQVARLTAVSGGSVVAGVGAHAVAGGQWPASCLLMLLVGGLACLATGAASCCAQRTRGPWAALGVLALGQAAMSMALALPSTDHTPIWTLPSATLHAVATAGLGALLLGSDRIMAGVARLFDVVAPRLGRGVIPAPAPRTGVPAEPAARERAVAWFGDRTLRGPPVLV